MRRNILIKIPAIAIMAAITVLSSLPGDDQLLHTFDMSDKIKHFIAYLVLGGSLSVWIPVKKWLARPAAWWALVVLICAAFGVLDEFHQSFVPGRTGNDLGDMTANVVGGAFAPLVYFLVIKVKIFFWGRGVPP